jgi:hypothetical protein
MLDNQEPPICYVNPKELENMTRLQTSSSVVLDIERECKDMPKFQRNKCGIPKIVHLVTIGGSFKFHHYLSLKSMHDRIKPIQIFVHGYDFPFDSAYFNQSIDEFKLTLVASRRVSQVFNKTVTHAEHKSDVIRLESLIRFGGIYLDLDTYVFKDIDDLLGGKYDFVISPENDYGLNNGIMMSKRCAHFPLLWYKEYKNFDHTKWADMSIQKPKALYNSLGLNRNPIIHVESSLTSNYGNVILFKNENETNPSFWEDTRILHSFWRDHGIEYNKTSVMKLDINLGRFARELFNSSKTA